MLSSGAVSGLRRPVRRSASAESLVTASSGDGHPPPVSASTAGSRRARPLRESSFERPTRSEAHVPRRASETELSTSRAPVSRDTSPGLSIDGGRPPVPKPRRKLPLRRNTEGTLIHPRELQRQAMGGVAALMLVGTCAGDAMMDPEVGALLSSGHTDMLSAEVCAMPDEEDSKGPSSGSTTTSAFSRLSRQSSVAQLKLDVENLGLKQFLSSGNSHSAQTASCLASGSSYEEENRSPTAPVTARRVTEAARGAQSRAAAAESRLARETRLQLAGELSVINSQQSPRSGKAGDVTSPRGADKPTERFGQGLDDLPSPPVVSRPSQLRCVPGSNTYEDVTAVKPPGSPGPSPGLIRSLTLSSPTAKVFYNSIREVISKGAHQISAASTSLIDKFNSGDSPHPGSMSVGSRAA